MDRTRLTLAVAAFLCAGLLVGPLPAIASSPATLIGTVLDTQGRPIADAQVTISGDGVGITRRRTNEDGGFRFPALRPSTFYTLTVELAGYRSVEYDGLRLEPGRTRTVDFRLRRPGEREVAVLVSRDPFPYQDLLRGVLPNLDVPVRVYDLDDDPSPDDTVRRVQSERPNLILGAGLMAARLIRREVREVPAVLTLISDPRRYDLEAPNLCFVSNNPVPLDLIRQLEAFIPDARQIGLIYDARSSSLIARDIREAARSERIKILPRPCYDPRDLEEALDAFAGRIDALLVPLDPLTALPDTAEVVTGWALRNRVPVVAPSPEWVRRGALFSYGATLESIGQDVSWIAAQILFRGRQPSELQTQAPRNHVLAVNEGTAFGLGLSIPQDVVIDRLY